MNRPATEPTAIIGMACRYASAPNLHAFWDLLVSGRDGVIDYPVGRTLELDSFYGSAGSELGAPSRRGGFLKNIDCFDADFFHISPREAELMDPQQRLLLELTWEALEDAGLILDRIAGPRTGVFIGAWASDYARQLDAMQAIANVQSTVFNELFAVSSRLAFAFDFRGPEVSVNGGCASSLIAIHQAVAALRLGACDVAFVGGVNAIIRPEITQAFAGAGVLSADGVCKFGDASADGYVRGEGAGILVLKRLTQAVADGDRIRAVVCGSAINNSGFSSGFIKRPSEIAQSEVILAAQADAGLSPADVQYVEAHGTGTTTGDLVEVAALAATFGRDRKQPCFIGSVKGNIGHTEAAAGVAAVIKTVLALEHRYLPPTLNVAVPNPGIDWTSAGIALNTSGRPWPDGAMRRAGVSSFALGGSNAHVILEEAPPPAPLSSTGERKSWALPLSTNSPAALKKLAEAYTDMLERRSDFADIVFTAANRRSPLPYRLVVVGADALELSNRLRTWSAQGSEAFVADGAAERTTGVVLVFPGQGSQWLGMGRELMEREPVFRDAIERCDVVVRSEVGWSVRELLETDTDWESSGIEKIQPALFSMQIALAALWSSWGVQPAVLVGHSMGEVTAACVAGAISLEDAASVICRRSALMTRLAGQGEMALVELSMDEATAALHGYEDRLSVAVSNGPRSTVISGEPKSLRTVIERLRNTGVFCRAVAVQVAAHSPQMDLISDELLSVLAGLRPRAGHTPIYSTTLGRLTDGAEFDGKYWVKNLRQPVLFHKALKALLAEGQRVFIEASPHPILLPAIDESGREANANILTLASMRRQEPEQATMLTSLGRLFVQGMAIDWSGIYPGGRLVDLPGHPWQRRRYWPDSEGAARVSLAAGGHPLLGAPFITADLSRIWTSRIGVEILPWLRDHAVRGQTLLPATAYLEMTTTAARQIFGHASVVVESLQLKEALVLPPSHGRAVQVAATIERPGHWSIKFHVHDDAADAWTHIGSAKIRVDDTLAASSLGPDQLETFGRKTASAISGDAHAARLKRLGYDFGPDFQNLLWLDAEGHTVRAAARVDDELKTTGYALHPALSDAGLQALVVGILQRGFDQALLIPRSIGQARLFSAAASARVVYILAEFSPTDGGGLTGCVLFYGTDGAPLAELRAVEFQALGTNQSAQETTPLYCLDWVATEGNRSAAGVPSTWLVVADQTGIGEAFASAMRMHGQKVEVIEPGADSFGFRGCAPQSRLTANRADRAGSGVVHFCSLNMPDNASTDRIAENAAEIAALATLIDESGDAKLWLVTRGACAAGLTESVSVPQASVWGLGAVIANECPDLGCRMIDLGRTGEPADAMTLAGEILSGDAEPRVALRGNQRRVPRLHPRADDTTAQVAIPLRETERADLAIATPGMLDSLLLRRALRRGPSAGEVEIEVHAAGLNFRDVIRAMGLFDPIANRSPKLGVECAGRVVRVGGGVSEFEVGDRVVALSPACNEFGTLASHLVTRAVLATKIPDGLELAQAAAIPCVFLTAYFALVEAARTRAGETVLIHSATGGVGLAAIQVARWIGAKIIASAGTAAKRAMLQDLGIEGVFDSRSAEYAKLVVDLTGGRGVDVILNSLSGGAIPEGLAALAPYGRFLEIGMRDMWDNSRIGLGALLLNRSIFGIDLASMIEDQPERVGATLRLLMEMVRDGVLLPLPTTVFPASRAAEAFQLMAAAQHTGKIVIDTAAMEVAGEAGVIPIRPDGSYLITGGLGALGLVAAEEMVEAGARSLVLCGRSAPSAQALQVVGRLRASGANVVTSRLDISDEGQLRDLLENVSGTLPPLRGVIHAAGVLDDALVDQLSSERFHTVMRGKVEGARLLDRLTAGLTLDFFVMFSSVAALLGSPAQGNYAAANAMLDALAEDRLARGKPGLSIAWGPWAEIGLAAAQENRGARIADRGLASLSLEGGRRLLRQLLGSRAPYVAAMHFDPASWLEVAAPSTAALFDDLVGDGKVPVAPSTAQLCSVGGDAAIRDLITGQLATVLRISPDHLAGDRPFRSLGLDSLMGLELRNRLERVLGLKLSASMVWNFPTVNQLCVYLAAQVGNSKSSPALAPTTIEPKQSAQALEDELHAANALLDTL